MNAANHVERRRGTEQLLVIDPGCGCWATTGVSRMADALNEGDLVVVNDAATLPASLHATSERGEPVEIRLMSAPTQNRWPVALLGGGDWRTPTQDRPAPPTLAVGDRLFVGPDLIGEVVHLQDRRLATLAFRSADVWAALYRHGRAVQYAYMDQEVPMSAVQTAFAGRPWAVEMPSAARPLTWSMLLPLMRRGVGLAKLTHGAGLSSIDGGALDRRLPLPERSDIPEQTVRAIQQTHRSGGRVLAVGTTVTRALEGRVHQAGALVPGESVTDLILTPAYTPQVVHGLLSNLHEPGESHFELMSAFAPREVLMAANATAQNRGFLAHEFGDATLIMAGALERIGPDGCVAA
ncbi:MAG: S-adenosylmethionine:tRNA ribosyltransferase-isomerase [Myxococcota bacterium]